MASKPPPKPAPTKSTPAAAPASAKAASKPSAKPAAPGVAKPAGKASPAKVASPAPSTVKPVASAKPSAPVTPAAPAKKAVAAKAAAPKAKSTPPAPPASSGMEAQQRSLMNAKGFFDKTLSCLEEGDSTFCPTPGTFSAAQQVAHVAQTYDWFLEGAFRPQGFDMDFAGMEQKVRAVTSLQQAKSWLSAAYERVQKALKERPATEWTALIAKDTIMGGAPRVSIVDGIIDHTAHHRGSLAVYARLRGKTPPMPYM